MAKVRRLFPTQIWIADLRVRRGLNDALWHETQVQQKLDRAGRAWSVEHYDGGYTSYASLNDLHRRSPTFDELRRLLDAQVKRYARFLQMDLGPEGRLEMSTCWVNVMGRRARHSFHLHPLSAVSGTYYVRLPRGAARLKLEDPRIACFMGSPPRATAARDENRRYVDVDVRPGRAVLWESWLKHEVGAGRAQEPRVSVSFNYDWT